MVPDPKRFVDGNLGMDVGALGRAQLALGESEERTQDLRRRVSELEAADRSRNEFLAVLAHEFRGPLALLKNAARLLEDPRTDDALRRDTQEMMRRQVGRMSGLLDDLFDLSRLIQGRTQVDKSRVTLNAAIQEAVETLRPQLVAHRQEITTVPAREPVWLDADAVRLRQVFGKLLDNASKFSAVGGRIRVTVERTQGPDGEEAVVRVIDEGIGIEAAMLPRVFEFPSPAEPSASRGAAGLGVGLTIARNLVLMHGGTIEAKSEGLGQGSEFVVRLPVAPEPGAPQAALETRPAERADVPRRILVVDDNVDGAKLLATLLGVAGHDVRIAFNGTDCLATADAFQPQAILLDLGLPGMDGYEVAVELRGRPGMEGVLLIALSGYGREEDRRKSREVGFDHHFVKPADLDAIQRILATRPAPV